MRNCFFALGSLALITLITTSGCSSSSPGSEADAGGGDAAPGQDATSLPDGPAPTWTNFAEAFTKTYCIECHNATDPDPTVPMYANQNFNLYADVVDHAKEARCGVSPSGVYQSGCPTAAQIDDGAFPPPGQFPAGTGPHPTDAERLRMIEWINNGTPEN
jgi:hypothetical protein